MQSIEANGTIESTKTERRNVGLGALVDLRRGRTGRKRIGRSRGRMGIVRCAGRRWRGSRGVLKVVDRERKERSR